LLGSCHLPGGLLDLATVRSLPNKVWMSFLPNFLASISFACSTHRSLRLPQSLLPLIVFLSVYAAVFCTFAAVEA
jgi:hypothetical protein